MKTGVQILYNHLRRLDSGLRRNDKKWCFPTFYEFIKFIAEKDMEIASLKKRISAARKEIPSDLVLKNGYLVNLFSGAIQKRDVAVCDGERRLAVGAGDREFLL